MREILTIGAYGWDAERFFAALKEAGVDTFVDVRARRGVRGHDYAFGNSQRLQARLGEMGLRYFHRPDLAPSPEARAAQYRADDASHTAKRQRKVVGPEFGATYHKEVLADLSGAAFAEALGAEAGVVALFCVEGEPNACHRSLLAQELGRQLRLPVRHIRP